MGKYHNHLDMNLENSCYTKIIKQVPEGSNVLEFGPAEGLVTQYLSQEKGCHVFIVEIDKPSFEQAMQFSERGILGDIEEYAWEQEFRDVAFDCVIFSDVLEHLRNPLEVLNRTKPLLKTDGMVLTSIPNIAHNDILLKLCEDRFDYTNIGLLDSTHIHFFAYNNICEIFETSGFAIVKEDWVESKTFHTEQATKDESAGAFLRESFYQRPCGEIYQFIMTARKREYVETYHVKLQMPIRERIENISFVEIPDYPLLLQEKKELIEQKENYIGEQREQLSERDREIMELKGTIEQIESSYSYRIGLSITYLPRMIRKWIHRDKENMNG